MDFVSKQEISMTKQCDVVQRMISRRSTMRSKLLSLAKYHRQRRKCRNQKEEDGSRKALRTKDVEVEDHGGLELDLISSSVDY